jgi:hypothetical protein
MDSVSTGKESIGNRRLQHSCRDKGIDGGVVNSWVLEVELLDTGVKLIEEGPGLSPEPLVPVDNHGGCLRKALPLADRSSAE